MSKTIDHSNYEAYFIDYLEGVLSAELQAEMELFMDENPEINFDLDVDGLILQAPEETLDTVVKLTLKKEVAITELNTSTLPYFAIAAMEDQLSYADSRELENWLSKHEEQRPIFNSYRQTRLEASQIIYANKAGLKRNTRIIPLWVKGSAIAASLALLITLGWNDQTTTQKNQLVANNKVIVKKKQHDSKVVTPTQEVDNTSIVAPEVKSTLQDNSIITSVIPVELARDTKKIESIELPVRELELEHATTLLAGNYEYTPSILPEEVPINEDLSWIPLEAMRNPIAPLTNKLTETLKTKVDFRTAKGTKNCGNGFLVKIGKFELSHRSACR